MRFASFPAHSSVGSLCGTCPVAKTFIVSLSLGRSCLPPHLRHPTWLAGNCAHMICRWLGCHSYCLTAPRCSASLRRTALGMALLSCSLITGLPPLCGSPSGITHDVNELCCCCPCGLCFGPPMGFAPMTSTIFQAVLSSLSYGGRGWIKCCPQSLRRNRRRSCTRGS